MKHIFIPILFFTATLSSAVACSGTKHEEVQASKELAMQNAAKHYVNDVIYPIYNDLAKDSSELYELFDTAADNGIGALSQDRLNAIAEKFLQARKSWEKSEAFLYGAATDFGIDPHIDTWPLDVDALVTTLSNTWQIEQLKGENGILYAKGKLGKELLGFHGIEYILFRDGNVRDANVLSIEELIYATAVAGDLRDNCWQLCAAWNADCDKTYLNRCEELDVNLTITGSDRSYGENMLNATHTGSTYASWQEVLSSILIAGCSNIANEVANTKMGNAHSGEDINYIESPYSKNSFSDFIDNIMSIQYSLYGKAGATTAESISIMTLLDKYSYSGKTSLDKAVTDALEALGTCRKKGAFVDIYTDRCVQDAIDAVNALDTELNKAAAWIVLQ